MIIEAERFRSGGIWIKEDDEWCFYARSAASLSEAQMRQWLAKREAEYLRDEGAMSNG